MALTISVIGTGYLGAVHAAGLARMGHTVVGVDRDVCKVDALRTGRAPLYEPGLDELLRETTRTGRLTFTTDVSAAAEADVHFVCVGTPQLPDEYAADTTHVFSAVEALAPHLRPDALVVGKSTVPVGTAHAVRLLLEKTAPAADAVRVAWNPEFLREGLAIRDTLMPDRLCLGGGGTEPGGGRRPPRPGVCRAAGCGHAPARARSSHGRAGQGRGQRVPGDEDILHQRDG